MKPELFSIENETQYAMKVHGDKLRLLYHQSFPAVFISLITSTLLTAILWSHVEETRLIIWFGSVLVSSLARLLLFYVYFRAERAGEAILRFEGPYRITLLFSALTWGVGCALIAPADSLLYQMVIYLFLIGMAGGALSVYSAIRSIALSTLLVILSPVTILFLSSGELLRALTGIGGCMFLLSAVRATRVLGDTLHRNFLMTRAMTEAKESAEWTARTDILTGLNNRRAFYDLAETLFLSCRRHGHPLAGIVLDVDSFKAINDTRGHEEGDLALKHVASCIRSTVRESDVCGRIGGDEFCILIPETEITGAWTLAERLRDNIAALPVRTSDGEFFVTASMGLATGGESVAVLLKMADQAMYDAKRSEKNRVHCYNPDRI